jgi:hypothetical protein
MHYALQSVQKHLDLLGDVGHLYRLLQCAHYQEYDAALPVLWLRSCCSPMLLGEAIHNRNEALYVCAREDVYCVASKLMADKKRT